MIKKFFEKDSVLKISSVLIAILVWLYVIYIEDPEIHVTVDDVPVRFKVSELSDDLALISQTVETVDVEIEASRSEIINFEDSEVEAYLDLAHVSESGNYDNVKIKVSCMNKNISIIDCSDNTTAIQVDDVIVKDMPVEVSVEGQVADGYSIIGEPETKLESVALKGPKSYIETVKKVYVQVDCEGISEDKTETVDLLLMDNNDAAIDKNHEAFKYIKLNEKKTTVNVSVGKTRTVDVVVSGLSDVEKYAVSPSTVEIYSENDNVNKIYTESIAGRLPEKDKKVKLKMIIPDGVVVVSEKKEVTVNLKN